MYIYANDYFMRKRKWKYGMVNPKTGFIFKAYDIRYVGGIQWLTPDQYNKIKKYSRIYSKKKWKDPKFRKRQYLYKQNPKYKKSRLEYAKNKWKNDEKYRNRHRDRVKIIDWTKTLFRSSQRASIKRKQSCTITPKWIKDKFNKQNKRCYWLGIEMIPSIHPNHPQQPSIDRMDNSVGYTKENTVLTCLFANLGRKDNPKEIMLDFISKIKK